VLMWFFLKHSITLTNASPPVITYNLISNVIIRIKLKYCLLNPLSIDLLHTLLSIWRYKS